MIASGQTPARLDVKPPEAAAPTSKAERTQWQYSVLSATDKDGELDELGAESWELIAVAPFAGGMKFIFKRPAK